MFLFMQIVQLQSNIYEYKWLYIVPLIFVQLTFLLHSGPHSKLKVSLPEVTLKIRPSTITSLSPPTATVADATTNP